MNGGNDAKKNISGHALWECVYHISVIYRFDRGRAQRNEKITFRYIIRVNKRIPTGCVPHGKLKSFLDILTGKLCVSTKFKFCIVFCLVNAGGTNRSEQIQANKGSPKTYARHVELI